MIIDIVLQAYANHAFSTPSKSTRSSSVVQIPGQLQYSRAGSSAVSLNNARSVQADPSLFHTSRVPPCHFNIHQLPQFTFKKLFTTLPFIFLYLSDNNHGSPHLRPHLIFIFTTTPARSERSFTPTPPPSNIIPEPLLFRLSLPFTDTPQPSRISVGTVPRLGGIPSIQRPLT